MATSQHIDQVVHQSMPTIIDNLKQLVSIPSIATEGYPQEHVLEAAHLTEAQLKAVGFQQARQRYCSTPTTTFNPQAKHKSGTPHRMFRLLYCRM